MNIVVGISLSKELKKLFSFFFFIDEDKKWLISPTEIVLLLDHLFI